MKKVLPVALFVSTCILMTPLAQAKSKPTPPMKNDAPVMDTHMQEMMKRSTPSEAHKIFESLAGDWATTVKFWATPGSKPELSTGTSTSKIIYGGRFLKQIYVGSFGGAPFIGQGVTGYDNIRQQYEGIWFDNFVTGIMKASGQYDPKTKTLSMSCTFSCPVTGEKDRWTRSEWVILDEKKNIYKTYLRDEKGQEYQSMGIVYSRLK